MTIQTSTRGIIELIGEHDVGKTLAAIQIVYPYTKTVFVDDDIKGDGTVKQMGDEGIQFGEYIDLAPIRAKLGDIPTPEDLLRHIVEPTVERIIEKKREVIIWDTWRIVYEASRGYVERNQQKFSKIVTFRGSSQIIQGLISKVARGLERQYLERLRDSCSLLVITHHVKDHYVNNVVVGKIPESSKTITEVCNMRIWLRRNPKGKVPIMLFLKRPSMPKKSGGKLKFVNVVPLKVTPIESDDSIWDAIKRYEDKPIQNRQPKADETPTAEEYSAISGTLSKEQKQWVNEMLKYQKEEIEDVLGASPIDEHEDNELPENGVQLLSMAQSRLDMNANSVVDALGMKLEKITMLKGKALENAWNALNVEE